MASERPDILEELAAGAPALVPDDVSAGAGEPRAFPAPAAEAPAPTAPRPRGTLKERTRQMSLYLEPETYDALREIAFKERTKMHPLLLQAVELFLATRGSPATASKRRD